MFFQAFPDVWNRFNPTKHRSCFLNFELRCIYWSQPFFSLFHINVKISSPVTRNNSVHRDNRCGCILPGAKQSVSQVFVAHLFSQCTSCLRTIFIQRYFQSGFINLGWGVCPPRPKLLLDWAKFRQVVSILKSSPFTAQISHAALEAFWSRQTKKSVKNALFHLDERV